MAINSKHPLYADFIGDWTTMSDTYRGERVVKEKGQLYLPATPGMVADGMVTDQPGWLAYQSYLRRAPFHGYVRLAVETLMGVMWKQPPVIDLPKGMEPMRERATVHNESLEVLLRRINEAQLTTGRMGMLVDFASDPTTNVVMPYIAMFPGDKILNWDAGAIDAPVLQTLNFVALDESEFERQQNFTWKFWNKYRILMLTDPAIEAKTGVQPGAEGGTAAAPADEGVQGAEPAVTQSQGNASGTSSIDTVLDYQAGTPGLVYKTATIRFDVADANFDPNTLQMPVIRGMPLDEIPFVFVNAMDILPMPSDPPLIRLAKLALCIYRGEADYRQNLFMQGQDTLVITGVDPNATEATRVGAGAVIRLPQGADAKYIGVGSAGLAEQAKALDNDKNEAKAQGGQLLDMSKKTSESGDALKTRVSAQTVTLNIIALVGAFALEQVLKKGAKWMGLNPDEVKVTPNLTFDDTALAPSDLVQLITAKNLGAPISLETIHDIMMERGMTEDEFEDEIAKIQDEMSLNIGPGSGQVDANGNPVTLTGAPGDKVTAPGAVDKSGKPASTEPSSGKGGNMTNQSAGGADNYGGSNTGGGQ